MQRLEAFDGVTKGEISRCKELVGRTHRRVVEDHLVDHRSIFSAASSDVTVGILFEEQGPDKMMVIRDILVGGPAWCSKQLLRGDVVVAIDGQELHGDAIIGALQGSQIPGTDVVLSVKKLQTGALQDVVLQRMHTSQVLDKRKMQDLFAR